MVIDESQVESNGYSALGPIDGSKTSSAKVKREGFQLSEPVSEQVSSKQSHTSKALELSPTISVADSDEDNGNLAGQEEQATSEPLPGEEIEYSLQISESSFYDFKGQASSTIGNIGFDSQLLPSNEVRLMLQLTKDSAEPVTLTHISS